MIRAPILVVVPTTGGPLVLRSLKRRPGLPGSAAFATGDYRPLPWSGDYARLLAEGGPVARLPGHAPGPYELRLSGSFDAGRSWEAPICLAHGLLARGHALTAEPAEAGLVIWATGAVDLDLAILPGDYALRDKFERSRALLAAGSQADLAILLPEGPERAEATRMFSERARPPRILPAESVAAALAALAAPEPAAPSRVARRPSTRNVLAGGLALAVLAAWGVALLGGVPGTRTEAPVLRAEPSPPSVDAPEPAILAEELVAPPGSSCRRVAFGADPPERRPIPVEAPGRLRASRLTPDLCGLAFRAARPGVRLAIGPDLAAAALPPVRLPDGAQAYYLREEGRRNRVYAVQSIPDQARSEADAPGDRLEHSLLR